MFKKTTSIQAPQMPINQGQLPLKEVGQDTDIVDALNQLSERE